MRRIKIKKIVIVSILSFFMIMGIVYYITKHNEMDYDTAQVEHEMIDREANQVDVSSYKKDITLISKSETISNQVPTIKDSENAYEVISTLDQKDSWFYENFENTKESQMGGNVYLSLKYYLQIQNAIIRVNVNDNSYRMIINEYNEDYKNIGYVDLCNGDIYHEMDSAKYITISIYNLNNGRSIEKSKSEIKKDLKNGLSFSLSRIEDLAKLSTEKEQLTGEVNIESLSNYYNYRKGWYQSWGGTYEYSEGSMCTRNFYKVDGKPYIYNVNDSRITLEITEYDKNGKWVKYNNSLINGGTFKKQPKTSYIGIAIRSRKWGANIDSIFQNGLRIDLARKSHMTNTNTCNFDDVDFEDTNLWKPGAYLYETGEYIIEDNKICYNTFCKIGSEDYTVNLPNGYLKMSILELNKDGKVLRNSELQSGQKWKKLNKTDKIALTVYGYNKKYSVSELKELVSEYSGFGLKLYERYTHSTQMNELTASQFVNMINVGWNLGNSLDSKSEKRNVPANLKQELNWGNPYITEGLINYVAKAGFNTIRIPVTWYYNTYEDQNGNLVINEEWLNRIQDVVDYAIKNNMYVILNTHHEQPIIYTGTDDKTIIKVLNNAKELWTQIAERFKTYDEHLIFEAYNEVDNIEKSWNYSDKAAAQMNQLNQVFVDTVRGTGGNNGNRILVVPTLLDGTDSNFYAAFNMPKDIVTDKIAVEVHFYTKEYNQDIENNFIGMSIFSKSINAPIIIGEFGTRDFYPAPELRAKQAANYVTRAAKYGLKCIWWDNGSDYKLIDRRDFRKSDFEMIKALLEAMLTACKG
ncbi:glycoside hydrolase family 5 protein [Anaeromicropila herbilytica]|uniref:Glycoside hydrolase family 5 domain-containing protein n=1 Tax=Anaeromicropila herbilytica TaxID=2785025 RepID=A0A7R7EHZ8_9FIRM|nr:glycoside hydrolase family 5 protein [Anaeromicropila herbilytica]BCN29026.1 hypothetical protein bsdtb5_03210 [Anaeromicropila herbilytica]